MTAGNRETSVNFMVNGINLNDLSNSQVTFQPSINTVSEFKVDNSTFSAEYGRNSGAIVNVATRSGSNQLHGEGFDFYRDDSYRFCPQSRFRTSLRSPRCERSAAMSRVTPFEPKFMPIGVLTAALQELTPRERRDPDPDLAIEEWLEFATELGVDCIQLSAALHPSVADVPAEAMLDPVANTLDLRDPFTQDRARRVQAAIDSTGVSIADVGYFDNMLHEDPIRRKKHDFMIRSMDAAALLGAPAVCGFVGRNQAKSMDQNLIDFEENFVPLLREAKARGLQVPRRAVPDARDGRLGQLPQQHRLHAGDVDRAAPDLRKARRRRPVPHPLRPVARDPDGPGHALDLPVFEGRRLWLPHRRAST